MSAPVVSSSSNISESSNVTSRNITHPSGLTAGDLMVLHVSGGQFGSNFNAPSGWTQLFKQTNSSGSAPRGNGMFYKVAASGDVSAGSTTITSDSTTVVAGMLRVTGTYVVGNAIALRDSSSQTSVSMSLPTNLTVGDLMVLMIGGAQFGDRSNVPSGWTQIYNSQGSGNTRSRLACYKYVTSGDISSGAVTITSDLATYERGIFNISQIINDSGDATFFTTEPIFFGNSTSLSVSGDAIFLETEPVFFNNTSRTKSKEWTNADKPITTWT
jgi:hypothetical protein